MRHAPIAMDLMQNYPKLFKIINFKGAGGPMFKTCQCAPYIAVMTISKFEPHKQVPFMSYECSKVDFHQITDYPRVGHNRNVWGMKLIFASRKLAMCSKIEHNIIEAITITCCEY